MQISAINSYNNLSRVNFTSKKRDEYKPERPQIDAPQSESSAKAMRAYIQGAIAALAIMSGAAGMTSCEKVEVVHEPDVVWAYADARAWACGPRRDTTVVHDTINNTDTIIKTIIDTVYVDRYPQHISDSIIAQHTNTGFKLNGPDPTRELDVLYQGSKFHNRYDDKFYESHLDPRYTSTDVLAIKSKMVDLYTGEEKVSWMHTQARDEKGLGVRYDRWISDSENDLGKYAGYEVVTNNRNGKNTVRVYDKNGDFVWKGDCIKGQQVGSFMFGTVTYDKDGNVNRDENGNPEIVHYDFDQAVVYSNKVIPNNSKK